MPDPEICAWGVLGPDDEDGYNQGKLDRAFWNSFMQWEFFGSPSPTMMHLVERKCLWNNARDLSLPSGAYIEIGAGWGCSLLIAANASEQRGRGEQVFSIDSFPYGREDITRAGLTTAVAMRCGAHLITGDRRVCDWLRAEAFRLAFIDGDHASEQVWSDLHAIVPLVADGGRIMLHDVWDEHTEGPIQVWLAAHDKLVVHGARLEPVELVHCTGVLQVLR